MIIKKSIFPFLAVLYFILIAMRCNKDHPPRSVLPPVTMQGLNTIGFSWKEKAWVPYFRCGFGVSLCKELSAGYGYPYAEPDGINLQFARKVDDKSSYFSISSTFIGSITSIGNKTDTVDVSFGDETSDGYARHFIGPFPGSKLIITKLDFQNQIISGEFEFVLKEQNGIGNEIILKDGRFDLKFNACRCSSN